MNNNNDLITLLLTGLNWFAAMSGVLILCAGFSFLPALFGVAQPGDALLQLGGIVFSKGVASAFPFGWSVGILIVGTFLYTWICSIFSMSTHLFIVSVFHELTFGVHDGDRIAWMTVAGLGLISTLFFVFVLYGTLLNMLSISLALLIIHVIGFILVLNYTDSEGHWVEMKFFA